MTEITIETNTSVPQKHKPDWLTLSAKTWFIVTAIGQWLFVAYIVGYYGLRFAKDGVSGFAGTQLANGFIAADSVGNVALVIHILLAGLIIAAGQIQLIPSIRNTLPLLHRCSGWFFMIASIIVSVAGFYLTWSRERVIGSLIQDIGVTGSGVLVMLFVPIALYYAIKRNFAAHRRWALRLFMVVSAVWFLRLMVFGWFVATGGIGIDGKTFTGPFLEVVSFAQYLLPLAVLELYFWASKPNNKHYQSAVASLIFLVCAAMAIGVFAISSVSWFPQIGA
ncbi:MAG: DUF2306 domain-containing protein [Gammaproteobacteria bacterium]|nr:DUF2306 domain-containing protein [Gammaproteobacteria bacterium]MBU2069094.1 DUF2306 domain-containing protein [Gammaproteobacteria bacterium]MBU2182651.1 DUF2306 domain-containing protein [Gammaproteobacteria bacterium]MBU2206578.1 DUF2306 domain-containing protein [Gammaproteobacteria bacterium]